MQLISVIICTHNPKLEYIKKTLQALREQTLSKDLWELLLIDNASKSPLVEKINLEWHPKSRYIKEDILGLTPARIRGIEESKANILVFVDDDNVLHPDYLEAALQVSRDKPFVGAWGGQIFPEFEEPPQPWTKAYWKFLAIRQFEQDRWSNFETMTCGAGLCVQRAVAQQYVDSIKLDRRRIELDRRGEQLTGGGDHDLAMTAHDLGLASGIFTALKMSHIMPSERLQETYLLKLVESSEYSGQILKYLRTNQLPTFPKLSWKSKLLQQYRVWKMNPRERRFHKVFEKGYSRAVHELSRS